MTLHLLLSLLVWFNVISRRGSKRKATLLSGGNGGFLFTSYLRISFEEGCISIGPLIFVFCFYHHRLRENTHTQYSKCQESVGNGGAERNGKPGFGRWKITCAGCYVWQNQKGNEKPRNATLRSISSLRFFLILFPYTPVFIFPKIYFLEPSSHTR